LFQRDNARPLFLQKSATSRHTQFRSVYAYANRRAAHTLRELTNRASDQIT
jgi:hypothetical protein